MDKNYIEDIIKKVLVEMDNKVKNTAFEPGLGIYSSIEVAIEKAFFAQKEFEKCTLENRKKAVEHLRVRLREYIEKISKAIVKETGMGRVEDKVKKHTLAIEKTPGVEDLKTGVFTGDRGLTLVELSAYGVIGALTPVTNPTETIINNTISALASGNSIVFCPHPNSKNVALYTIKLINDILEELAEIPKNLVTASLNVSLENTKILFESEQVSLLVVTGSSKVVDMAMKSGKKVIGAATGNAPVIVDETANIPKAAKDIVMGASFDNNILCVSEKVLLTSSDITDYLVFCMQKEGAFKVENDYDIEKLEKTVLENGLQKREFIGKDASYILRESGIEFSGDPKLILIEKDINDSLVKNEMMMPILPIVRHKNFEEILKNAKIIEKNLNHTAIIHSQNITRLSQAAKELKTTIFIKNAPSYISLGFEGEGYGGFTIASRTGEGIVSAKDFSRIRRCILSDSFSIK